VSSPTYYSKQLIVHGQIEHRQTPTLNLVSSTINNASLPTTTIIDNPASPPSPTATTSHDRQYPLPSALTTVTDRPSPRWHTPTTGTTRWQIHVTSAQRVDEHYAMSTARGNDNVACQQYVPHRLDGDEASRWVAPTPFPLCKLLDMADGNDMAHQQHAVSSDSHNSTHQWTNSTTTHVYKPPNGAQSTTMANDYNDPKPNGCHSPQWPPWPTMTTMAHNNHHGPQWRPLPTTTSTAHDHSQTVPRNDQHQWPPWSTTTTTAHNNHHSPQRRPLPTMTSTAHDRSQTAPRNNQHQPPPMTCHDNWPRTTNMDTITDNHNRRQRQMVATTDNDSLVVVICCCCHLSLLSLVVFVITCYT